MNSLRDLQFPIRKKCIYDIRFREASWRFSFNAGNQRHALKYFGQLGGGVNHLGIPYYPLHTPTHLLTDMR